MELLLGARRQGMPWAHWGERVLGWCITAGVGLAAFALLITLYRLIAGGVGPR